MPADYAGAGGRADKSVRGTRVLVIFQGSGAAREKRVPLRLRRFGMTLLLFKLLAADADAGGRADKSVRATRVLVIFQGSGAAGEKRVPLRLRRFGMTLLLFR
jgi:hypothetical protein